jgi:hypothetical protein
LPKISKKIIFTTEMNSKKKKLFNIQLPNLKRYSSIKNLSLDLQWANCKLEWRKALFIEKMNKTTFNYHEAQYLWMGTHHNHMEDNPSIG